MKFTKKCENTKQNNESIKEKLYKRRYNKRRSSAGMFYTSSAGAVTSLILMATLSFLSSVFCNLSGLTGSTDAYATSSTITVNIATDITLDLSPIKASGTFATSDTSANNVSVKTDNGTGYTLGIKASTDNSNALSTTGGASIPSHTITAGVSESNYEDDTYAEANNLNNTWGYRPSKLNSVSNSNYLPGPTSASTVIELDKTNVANASTFNNYNLAIGARVDTATVPGEYSNVFVFTVVANPAVYSITYNKNTTDTVTNMPANVVNQQTSNETVTLDSAVPVRDGYNFKGWCTTQVADNGTCSGTTYNAGGTWTLDQTLATNSLNVYAIWKEPEPLYDLVATMSKGTQDVTALRTAIDAPDETETVSTNSGVYEYNASVFGTASDDNSACTRAGGCPIYYYRGVLDSYGHTGTYGSNGDNDAFPNTVVLSSASSKSGLTTNDTCWRIVRTTGSGGVKMIYQGKWTANGDSGNCKNAQTNAQVTTQAFGLKGNSAQSSNWYKNINRVGYTFNNTQSLQDNTTSTSVDTVFGSDSSPETNNARSNIKTYIEDTWYSGAIGTSSGHDYTSKLEANAGYCNDRTAYTNTAGTSSMSDIPPYATSGATMYFGSYARVANATSATINRPSLNCPRSTVDLYRYVTSSTTDYTSNELKYPAALLTADEAAFAGSGYSSSTTPYHANAFLRSGSVFWLLSPFDRGSSGNARGFYLHSNGYLHYYYVNRTGGVRPAISLTSGTVVASGSGTATDPWIVNP